MTRELQSPVGILVCKWRGGGSKILAHKYSVCSPANISPNAVSTRNIRTLADVGRALSPALPSPTPWYRSTPCQTLLAMGGSPLLTPALPPPQCRLISKAWSPHLQTHIWRYNKIFPRILPSINIYIKINNKSCVYWNHCPWKISRG